MHRVASQVLGCDLNFASFQKASLVWCRPILRRLEWLHMRTLAIFEARLVTDGRMLREWTGQTGAC